jgi:hypothetical protein
MRATKEDDDNDKYGAWRPDKSNDEQGGGWRTKSYPQAYIASFGEGDGKPLRYTFYQMRLHAIGTYDTLDAAKHAAERYYEDE